MDGQDKENIWLDTGRYGRIFLDYGRKALGLKGGECYVQVIS